MSYWIDRELQAQNRITNRGIKATEEQLRKYYLSTMNKTIGQFEKTYNKVLSSIKEGKEVTPADLYKLDKYWQMQGQLQYELQKLGDKTHQLMSKKFKQQYKDVYECLPFKDGAMFNTIDEATASQMINQIWCADGKSWSERIWTNTDKLQQALNDNLIHCVVSGKTTSELNRMLQQDFKASFSRADTIIRTEMARIQTQSALERYKSYGVQQVEILADDAGCTHCKKLHKTKYFVNEKIPIPVHPNCRCCIIPVVEDEQVDLFAQAGYNGYEPCYKDGVDFNKNQDVQKAVSQKTTNFVRTIEPKTLDEFNEILYGKYVEKVKPLSGYYDIKAHGQFDSIKLFNTTISAETLAKILVERKDYRQGTPIRLLSCYTGKLNNGKCFAQDLANMLNTEVVAPDYELMVSSQGVLFRFVGREKVYLENGKAFKKFKPKQN